MEAPHAPSSVCFCGFPLFDLTVVARITLTPSSNPIPLWVPDLNLTMLGTAASAGYPRFVFACGRE